MNAIPRTTPNLMPLVALAALAALVAVPTLSSSSLHAAAPVRFTRVIVHPGDALWAIAARYTPDGENVDATLDQIRAVNHLSSVTLQPGQILKIPQ
jgi:LysM repeat protein